MRCRICGAELKKEGDICTKCYKEYQEEEDLKKDVNEILTIKRKYSIIYEVTKYAWIILIFILAGFMCLTSGGLLEVGLVGLIFLFVFGGLLFLDKRLAIATKMTFYEKKVVKKFDFAFIHQEKVVKYSDLKDVTYIQTFTQKRFGFGDLCVYAKGPFPGATLLNGFQVKNVENVKEVLEIIAEIMTTINEQ